MKRKVIHKFVKGLVFNTWGCDTDGVREENTTWRWKDVTCKLCLAKRPAPASRREKEKR